MQHGKTELNGLLRANRTGITQNPSRSAGEDTPLTISAYDSMRRVGVMFLVTSSRVAPQENLLLLSQQKFVWDRSFLLALTRFARCKSLVGQPSEFPKSLIWQEFTTFGF